MKRNLQRYREMTKYGSVDAVSVPAPQARINFSFDIEIIFPSETQGVTKRRIIFRAPANVRLTQRMRP